MFKSKDLSDNQRYEKFPLQRHMCIAITTIFIVMRRGDIVTGGSEAARPVLSNLPGLGNMEEWHVTVYRAQIPKSKMALHVCSGLLDACTRHCWHERMSGMLSIRPKGQA
jgi:hypothetical protein